MCSKIAWTESSRSRLRLESSAMDPINTYIDQFIEATISNQRARLSCDAEAANQYFTDADRYICEIKRFPDWTASILPLLKHENIAVRIRAASILLPFTPIRARIILLKCGFAPGEDGFEAQMILKAWDAGSLEFPAFENGSVVYKSQRNE